MLSNISDFLFFLFFTAMLWLPNVWMRTYLYETRWDQKKQLKWKYCFGFKYTSILHTFSEKGVIPWCRTPILRDVYKKVAIFLVHNYRHQMSHFFSILWEKTNTFLNQTLWRLTSRKSADWKNTGVNESDFTKSYCYSSDFSS